MAKIARELREWASNNLSYKTRFDEIIAIADRIDEAHESALASAYGEGAESVALPDMTAYVKLPVDAEGEVWHVGDFAVGEVNPKNPKAIERMIWYGPDSGWQLETNTIIYPCPDRPRHHHAPTVEDVLTELTDEVWNRCCVGMTESDSGISGLVAKYAKKLRLASDAE